MAEGKFDPSEGPTAPIVEGDIPDEFAITVVTHYASGAESDSRVIDARFPVDRLAAINAVLERRGHQPMQQITAEQVAAHKNTIPFATQGSMIDALGRSVGRFVRLKFR